MDIEEIVGAYGNKHRKEVLRICRNIKRQQKEKGIRNIIRTHLESYFFRIE